MTRWNYNYEYFTAFFHLAFSFILLRRLLKITMK